MSVIPYIITASMPTFDKYENYFYQEQGIVNNISELKDVFIKFSELNFCEQLVEWLYEWSKDEPISNFVKNFKQDKFEPPTGEEFITIKAVINNKWENYPLGSFEDLLLIIKDNIDNE